MTFAIQCKASRLYLCNMTPCRASIEITPVPAVAVQYKTRGEAKTAADALRPLFGSFDWQPVQVNA
jgi:hypothetical protein